MRHFFALLLSFLFITPALSVEKSQYCTAIRGNGQLAPAHWSALSRLVEELGMPQAMAGGSSASVTMFFLESIAASQAVTGSTWEQKNKQQALLLKTLPLYMKTLAAVENIDSAFEFMKQLSDQESSLVKNLQSILELQQNRDVIIEQLKTYGPLFNPEMLKSFLVNPLAAQLQLEEAISVFGSFNAVTDDHLFFRPGLVDFKYFSILLGKISDFYTGNVSPEVLEQQKQFLAQCSEAAFRQLWPHPQLHQSCQNQFSAIVARYISETKNVNSLGADVFKPVGYTIPTFPITSVLTGSAYSQYLNKKNQFIQGQQSDYQDFSILEQDLQFGYWGPSEQSLSQVQQQLLSQYPDDFKSQKFFSLGTANWFDVLATSPAEPGLANFQKIPENTTHSLAASQLNLPFNQRWEGLNYKQDMISAGGWPDLHPTLVLKAHGCDNVVYLTRQAWGSTFGQQIFVRLMGLKEEIPFWTTLGQSTDRDQVVRGTPAEGTPWDKLYNVTNPQSSFNLSLSESEAVYCTNWDDFNIFSDELSVIVADAYQAPVLLKPETTTTSSALQVNPRVGMEFTPGCTPYIGEN